jgi:hypothetical protein
MDNYGVFPSLQSLPLCNSADGVTCQESTKKKNVNGLSLLLFPFFNELLLFAINLLPVAGRKEAASSRLEALPRKLEKGYSIHLHLDGVGKNTYLLAWASCRTPKNIPLFLAANHFA